MSDIKLFRIRDEQAIELSGSASGLEKPLQNLIERNLETLLGIRFLASEHSTGRIHGGRIDTLGLDENFCPCILEYKRSMSENVINQGLFYLDWLMDHKAEFKLLVLERFGKDTADAIDWSQPRLLCIASDFTKYDGHAVQQIDRNIELIRYRRFGTELLLLELANAPAPSSDRRAGGKAPELPKEAKEATSRADRGAGPDKSFAEMLETLPESLRGVLSSLDDYMLALGDDVQRKELRLYVAYKRIKNYATLVVQKGRLLLYLHLEPAAVVPALPAARDVTSIGHWGTGDVEVTLTTTNDLEAAKPYILAAYEGRARSLT